MRWRRASRRRGRADRASLASNPLDALHPRARRGQAQMRQPAPLARAHNPQAHNPGAGRARLRLACALAGPLPDQRPLRAHLAPVQCRERARPFRLPVDLGQQHPRARLRPPPEGQQGTRGGNDRLRTLGHDHADPHRRRARGASVDPARHGRRNPRPRPAEDQRGARVRRAGTSRYR